MHKVRSALAGLVALLAGLAVIGIVLTLAGFEVPLISPIAHTLGIGGGQ